MILFSYSVYVNNVSWVKLFTSSEKSKLENLLLNIIIISPEDLLCTIYCQNCVNLLEKHNFCFCLMHSCIYTFPCKFKTHCLSYYLVKFYAPAKFEDYLFLLSCNLQTCIVCKHHKYSLLWYWLNANVFTMVHQYLQ